MAKGKVFDTGLVVEFARRHGDARGKAEKGEAIRWFMDSTGCSWSTAHNVLIRMRSGMRVGDIAVGSRKRTPRKNDIERERERKDAMIVSGIKRMPGEDKKWIPTGRAIEIAEGMGLIRPGEYTRSRMDRMLKKIELNFKSSGIRRMAHRITADYPGHVFVVDATPMDQYYMRLDLAVVRYDAPRGDKHLDDLLTRENLVKIWVYYVVDLYSKAFLALPFIPVRKSDGSKNGGENSEDWLTFLKWSIMPKRGLPSPLEDRVYPLIDCPVEGVPDILYCDRGSGIGGNNQVKRFCTMLGSEVRTHLPKNPSAKGMVEGRIGAFKKSFESQVNHRVISNINQLIFFYQAWAHYWNTRQGYYDVWQKGILRNPIRRATEQNMNDAMVSHITRTVNGYGCVQIDKGDWFVTWDGKYRGTKATIYRPPVRGEEVRYIAELYDGSIVNCSEGTPSHGIDDITAHPTSAGERNRKEARLVSQNIGSMMTFDDILPAGQDSNVVRIPSPAKTIETHSPVAPSSFTSVDHAWRWILTQSGIFAEELEDKTIELFKHVLTLAYEKYGSIPADVVIPYSNLLSKQKHKRGAIEQ